MDKLETVAVIIASVITSVVGVIEIADKLSNRRKRKKRK